MKRRSWLVLSGLLVCAIVAMLGPAGSASGAQQGPTESCNQTGRLFCLTLSTFDGITASDPGASDGKRYTWVEWTMSNIGGSTLTNPQITVNLTDYCGASACAGTTSSFVMPDSSSACVLSTGTLTCKYANLPAGGNTGLPTRIYFKTANEPATRTVIAVRGTVKESANDNNPCGSGDPNCDTFLASITNSYEPDANAAYTFALNGNRFYLETDDVLGLSGKGSSSYTFTSGNASIFRANFVTSFPAACGATPSPTCFNRVLTVSADGAPSTYNAGPVVFYARLTNLPQGVNANNVTATHTYDDTTSQIIGDVSAERSSSGCTFTYSNQIPVPSICAKKVQGMQAVDVWVWDSQNGGIKFG
jgi:hypothetical protein